MENRNLLTVILVAILVIYVFFFTYLMIAYVVPAVRRRRKQYEQMPNSFYSGFPASDINTIPSAPIMPVAPMQSGAGSSTAYQTDFFNQSLEYARNYLYSNNHLPGYKYGMAVDLGRLRRSSKRNISQAMKLMASDSMSARAIEQKLRAISEQEHIALWMVILHEAIKRVNAL